MTDGPPRPLALLDERFLLAVVVLAGLVLVGGWLTYDAHVAPGTETEERTVATWTTDAEFRHAAEVREDTSVYPEGTLLRNRSSYFTTVSPQLEGTYVLDVPDRGDPAVETELALELAAVGRDGGELWTDREPLANASTSSAGEHRVAFAIDVPAVRQRIADTNGELGVSPRTVEVSVVAESTLEAEGWSETRTDGLNVEPGSGTYAVEDRSDGATTHERTETVTVSRDRGPARGVGGPGMVLLGLVGLAALTVLRVRGTLPLSDADRRAIERDRERRRFDEWISRGRVPAGGDEVVRMASLADLVDVAIDSDRRVIESDGRYYVLLSGTRYVYDPGAGSARSGSVPNERAPGPDAPTSIDEPTPDSAGADPSASAGAASERSRTDADDDSADAESSLADTFDISQVEDRDG